MAAIGRRAFLLGASATHLRADARQEIHDLLANMATDLANGLARPFVKNFSPSMPGFAELSKNVDALLATADVSASVEVREVDASAARVVAQVDWYLECKAKRDITELRQRREILRMEFQKSGKRWQIVTLSPSNFFRPI